MHRKRRIKTSQFNVTEQRFLSQRYFRLGCPGSSTGKYRVDSNLGPSDSRLWTLRHVP